MVLHLINTHLSVLLFWTLSAVQTAVKCCIAGAEPGPLQEELRWFWWRLLQELGTDVAAPQPSQAFVIPAIFPRCPLFPPQHFPTLVGQAELGTELRLPLGHPVLFPETSAPPGSQICFGWKEPGGAGAPWRLCPAIKHPGLGWGQEFSSISAPNTSNLAIVTRSLFSLCPCVVRTYPRL